MTSELSVQTQPKPDSVSIGSHFALELRSVRKRFGDKIVLDDVTLGVEKGRSLVIIGGSGQGKSVTLKIAIGLMRPESGQIWVDGQDVTNLKPKERAGFAARFGMLFQGGALFDSLSVWENVAFRLIYVDGWTRLKAREKALETLSRVGLNDTVGDLYPIELSGGMQKRVALARAVVSSPEIIFFDEPTTGLDPINADIINHLIVEQVKRLGATTISITHDMASARKIGDEIAMLHKGKILWRGKASEIDHSGNPYVDQFVRGSSEGPMTTRP